MNHRNGVTLTEVLVSIFIMGIGLLSLLVLFPVGALNMAQAIKDERAAQAAQTAAAVAKIWNVRNDSFVLDWTGTNPAYTNAPRPPAYYLYTYPDPAFTGGAPPGQMPPLTALVTQIHTIPSYPVFIDPIGYNLGSRKIGYRQGYSFGIPRTSLTFLYEPGLPNPIRGTQTLPQPPVPPQPPYPLTTPPQPQPPTYPYPLTYSLPRWFTLLDDMNYEENGRPKLSGGSIQRESRYSWAYLCRQVRADIDPSLVTPGGLTPNYAAATTSMDPAKGYDSKYGVNLTVVVYDRRPWLYTGAMPTSDDCAGESTYQANFTYGSNIATLLWAAGTPSPPIKRGTWILDATMTPIASNGFLQPSSAINGYFYRVLNATPTSATTMDVELHINARATASTAQGGVAVVMENVVEVFDRGKND